MSASPLGLGMARRALADSLVATLMVASLWLCLRALLRERSTRLQWVGVTIIYGVAFLAKEITMVLIPISLLLIGWFAVRQRRFPTWQSICAVSVLPLLCATLIVVLVAGDASTVWQTAYATVTSTATNPYAIAKQNGPWFRYLLDFLLLSPWTTVLYVVWCGYLINARTESESLKAWALIPLAFLLCAVPFTKNIRYALALEVPIRLGAVCLLNRLSTYRLSGFLGGAVLIVLVVGLMWTDLQTFQRLFVIGDLYDPVTATLLSDLHFLPQ